MTTEEIFNFLKEENIDTKPNIVFLRNIGIKPNIAFLREKFNNRLHIEEISYSVYAPIRINIRGCLPKEQAEEIFYNIIPICHIWTYKQDKRIKQFKYVWLQESEEE